MQKGARLQLGGPVRCADGPFGDLADVVMDPIRKRVTHLVVEPKGSPGLARLVPVELAEGGEERTGSRSAAAWMRQIGSRPSTSRRICGWRGPDRRSATGMSASRMSSRCRTTRLEASGRRRRLRLADRDDLRPRPEGRGRDPPASTVVSADGTISAASRIRRGRRRDHALRARARSPVGKARRDDPDRRGRQGRDRRGDHRAVKGRGRRPAHPSGASVRDDIVARRPRSWAEHTQRKRGP